MSAPIVARDVALEFSNGRILFTGVSVSLQARRTALIGPNGIGKSALARLLAGELDPTRGDIQRRGPVRFFAQREAPPSVAVRDLLCRRGRSSPLHDELLKHIDTNAACTSLSGGEWTRVRLARTLDEGFLILDEPSNNLDHRAREILLRLLRSHSGGLLLISHDRKALRVCDDILELSSTGLMKFGGGWDGYVEESRNERDRLTTQLDRAKRARDEARAARVEQQARQEKRNRRGRELASRGGAPAILLGGRKSAAEVSTGKRLSASLARSAGAIQAAHEALRRMKSDPVMYAEFSGAAIPAQKIVAEARDFNVRFAEWVFAHDLDFSWRGNVRVALKGANGSGKSTLLQSLLHDVGDIVRGEIQRGELATLYLDQHCAILEDDATVLENTLAGSSRDETEVRNALARFLFTGDSVFRKVRQLSGGERVRAALARGLLATRKPQLMLLDEPTNNLDLANVEFLENVVSQFRGALVVVSHDERFMDNCRLSEEMWLAPPDSAPD